MAVLVLGYAGVSRRLERTVLTAPILFVTAGLLVGGEALGWVDLRIGSGAVRTLAEATLTLVLFTDASRIDLRALRREVALPARLLGIGLPLTIAAGTGLALLVFGQLDWPRRSSLRSSSRRPMPPSARPSSPTPVSRCGSGRA